jgi:integrase
MFNLAIDSKLRGCDVVALTVEGRCAAWLHNRPSDSPPKEDGSPGQVRVDGADAAGPSTTTSRQQARSRANFCSPATARSARPMTVRQYARLVSEWIASIGLDPRIYSTHSLRRTKVTLIYRRTGNLRAVQLLLGTATYCPRTTD